MRKQQHNSLSKIIRDLTICFLLNNPFITASLVKGLKEIQVTFVKTSYYYHTSHQHVSIKCAPILKIQKKNCITFKKRDKGNIILYSY